MLLGTLLTLSAVLVRHFASPRTSISIQILATISFGFGFCGTLLLPVDLSLTEKVDDEGKVNATNVEWHIVFWVTFFLAWLILPISRQMLLSGEFTVMRRFQNACKRILIIKLIQLLVVVVLIISLAVYMRSIHISAVLLTFCNTYGLLLAILLLGYGLVALPRFYWEESNPEMELRKLRILALSVDEELFEYVWKLQDCEYDIDLTMARINNIQATSNYFRAGIDELMRRKRETSILSPELQMRRSESRRANAKTTEDEKTKAQPTEAELSKLNYRIKQVQENLFSTELRWEALAERGKFLSALVEGPASSATQSISTKAGYSILDVADVHLKTFRWKLYYCWMKYLRSTTFKILAASAAFLSAIILWSEATLAVPFNLSPFGLLLNSFSDETRHNGFLFQICASIPILYMSACVYYGLFKLSSFGSLCLRGHKQVQGSAFLFNSIFFVRMQFPLGYNYLLMLKYHASYTDCAFAKFMGNMAVVPIFGESFSVYAPLLIIVLGALSLFNVYPRFLAMLGVVHEDALLAGNEETLDRKEKEGKMLLRRFYERKESNGCRESYLELQRSPSNDSYDVKSLDQSQSSHNIV
jgi:hypothetical protein